MQIDFSEITSARDRVAVVATEPLTRDETWHQGTPGTMWVFDQGKLRATLPSVVEAPVKRPTPALRSRKTMSAPGGPPRASEVNGRAAGQRVPTKMNPHKTPNSRPLPVPSPVCGEGLGRGQTLRVSATLAALSDRSPGLGSSV